MRRAAARPIGSPARTVSLPGIADTRRPTGEEAMRRAAALFCFAAAALAADAPGRREKKP